MRLIYLAGPYSSKDQEVKKDRVIEHQRALAYFAEHSSNLCLYSPIAQWGPIAYRFSLPGDFNYWAEKDYFMIRQASALWVLTLPGWQDSYGLSLELEYAHSIERDVVYVLPEANGYVLTDTEPTPGNPIG